MPFDVSKSCGKWKQGEHSDNYKEVLEKLGYPAEMFEKWHEAEYQIKSTLSGNTLTTQVDFLGKSIVNTHVLGTEGQEEDPTGKKRKVTFTTEGDCLISVYPDHDGKGLVVRNCHQFLDDNTIKATIKAADLEGWATSKRC